MEIPDPGDVTRLALAWLGVPAIAFTIWNLLASVNKWINAVRQGVESVSRAVSGPGFTGLRLVALTVVQAAYCALGYAIAKIGWVAYRDNEDGRSIADGSFFESNAAIRSAFTYNDLDSWPGTVLLVGFGFPALLTLAAATRSDFLGWALALPMKLLFGGEALLALLIAVAGTAVLATDEYPNQMAILYGVIAVLLALHAYCFPLLLASLERVFAWRLPHG